MRCPRCQKPMSSHDAPLPDGGTVIVERCRATPDACGVWYDAEDLAAVHVRLGDRAVRESLMQARLVASARTSTTTSAACPRCAQDAGRPVHLHPVRFVGLTLDLCERCGGLWIDRAEYPALMSALQLYEPGESEAATTHYRAAATGPVMKARPVPFARCVGCRAQVPLEQSLVTEKGLACALCAARADEAAPAGTAREASSSLTRALSGVWSWLTNKPPSP